MAGWGFQRDRWRNGTNQRQTLPGILDFISATETATVHNNVSGWLTKVHLWFSLFQVQAESNNLKKKLQQAEAKLESLSAVESENISVTEQYNKILTDNGALIKQVDEMYNQIKVLNEVQKKYTEAIDENAILQSKMKNLEENLAKIEDEYEKLQHDTEMMQRENSTFSKDVENTMVENKVLRQENEKLKSDLKLLKDERNRLLQDAGEDKQGVVKAVEEERSRLAAEFEEERKQFNSAKDKLAKENENLRKEYQKQVTEAEKARIRVRTS